jgi:hypothetical protein
VNKSNKALKPPTTHRFSEMSNFAQTPDGQRRKSILIDTPSQGVRSSIQLAEPDPGVLASPEICRAKGNSVQLPAILQGELLRRLLQGAAAGAIATIIIGFSWGVSTLGSTAKKLATDETRNAIVTIAAPACAEHFANKANDEKWAEYQRVDVWRRDTYIKEAGYATVTGLANDYSTSWAIAHACVKALNRVLETRTK